MMTTIILKKNKSYNNYHIDYKYEWINISINISKQCNFTCSYCFNQNKKGKALSFDTIKEYITKIINDTPYAVKYHMDLSESGEPLLELSTIIKLSDFCMEISNKIRKEVLIMFVSNGYLLTNKVS